MFAVAWVTIQGGYNSSLAIGLAVYILYFSFGWVSNIFVKMAFKLLFWFSGEEYFLNYFFFFFFLV